MFCVYKNRYQKKTIISIIFMHLHEYKTNLDN